LSHPKRVCWRLFVLRAQVRRTAKKMLKIAALTVTKTAKAATAQAVRGVVRGLGDNNRITLGSADGSRSKPRLQRGWSGWGERPDRPARRGGRRVIVYVGVRR
ncbi:unnamed protein product, partial [Sphacelaria rigidula]